ncbi:hypothetical protein H0R92_01655 [Treponema sp. OMZ 840]|uniref:hypothetical protein n=1 Tax=Treponema sp. OMZ 840 TaxID=244313 RepID=UPI003D9175CC
MKKLFFIVSFLLLSLFFQIYAQKSIKYCELSKIETIKDVIITKRDFNGRQENITIKLNESQKKEFFDRIKISKHEKYIKVSLDYEVSIAYDNNETEVFFMTGRVIKKQDGKTFTLDNNMNLFLNSLFTDDYVSNKYKERLIETDSRRIQIYQPNYSRNNLLFIGSSESINSYAACICTWKVGRELIDVQYSFFKKKYLKNYIKEKRLKELADIYLKEIHKLYPKQMIFKNFEIHPIDENNKKFIIYFNYKIKLHNKGYLNEVVYMMPDGTIVISDNNYENIQF